MSEHYYPPRGVKTETGEFKFTGANTETVVTRTITLSNPGVSLDRMKLTGLAGAWRVFLYGTAEWTGHLLEAKLTAVDTITLKIMDRSAVGTSTGAFCWTVERW